MRGPGWRAAPIGMASWASSRRRGACRPTRSRKRLGMSVRGCAAYLALVGRGDLKCAVLPAQGGVQGREGTTESFAGRYGAVPFHEALEARGGLGPAGRHGLRPQPVQLAGETLPQFALADLDPGPHPLLGAFELAFAQPGAAAAPRRSPGQEGGELGSHRARRGRGDGVQLVLDRRQEGTGRRREQFREVGGVSAGHGGERRQPAGGQQGPDPAEGRRRSADLGHGHQRGCQLPHG